jgi:cation diffusion facilitator CzcD-associated flavoprotein CzcO
LRFPHLRRLIFAVQRWNLMKAHHDKAATPRIAVIGAGVCGIGTAVLLARAGIRSFDIFEATRGVGGTWLQNRYPGASVDVHSLLYQYSFKNHHWKRSHPTQKELLAYLEETVSDYGLTRHLHLNTTVDQVAWDDGLHCYHLTTAAGDTKDYEIVVSAVGFLNVPNMPDWPGLDKFTGEVFHTAAWNNSADLTGKRVAIVGVGSSAAQIIPSIQPEVERLYVFQREPGWVLPRHSIEYTPTDLAKLASPRRRLIERFKAIARFESTYIGGPHYIVGSRSNKLAESVARNYIDTVFRDRPDLRAVVTPKYVFSGKRRVLSDEYYPSLLNDNVELVPWAVAGVTEKGVVDANGCEYGADALIIATGFTAWRYLARLRVLGRNGLNLHEVWRDGAFAFNGMTVPGFPNFYMLYGPNTNGGGAPSVHWLAEQQANSILRDIARMRKHGYAYIDTKKTYTIYYNRWLQRRLRRTTWSQANNYMRNESGRLVTQFHGSMTLHWILMRVLQPLGTFGVKGATSGASSSPNGLPGAGTSHLGPEDASIEL